MTGRHLRWIRCCIWFSLVLMLAGCADYAEVEDLLVVTGVAIDIADAGQLSITLDIINPDQGASQDAQHGGGGHNDIVVRSDAQTLEAALDQLQAQLPHRLYLAHNAVVVLQRNVLSQHLPLLMDYLERNRSMRRSQLLVMTTGRAGDLWKVDRGDQSSAALRLRDLVEQAADQSPVYRSDQLHAVKRWLTPSGSAWLTWIDLSATGDPKVMGVAAVTQDGRSHLIPLRNHPALLWWVGDTHTLLQTVPCGAGRAEPSGQVAVRWLHTHTQVHWSGTVRRPAFSVAWTGVGEIERWCPGMTLDDAAFRAMERATAQTISEQMRVAWDDVRVSEIDVLGLQNVVYREAPQVYRSLAQWPGWWQTAEVHFDVRSRLVRSHMAADSPLAQKVVGEVSGLNASTGGGPP